MKINQIKTGAVLAYVVLGLNTLVGLAYTPFLLRKLGQSEYGLYSLIASVIAYLTLFDLGFGNTVVRYTAKYRAEGKEKEQGELFGMFLIIYVIIGIIAFLIGLVLFFNVTAIFDQNLSAEEIGKAKIMVLIMIFNLAISFPLSIFSSIVIAYERFVFQKSVQIIRIILNTLVMIVVLEMGYKAIALVIVLSFFNLSSLLSNFIYCKTKLGIHFRFGQFKKRLLKELSGYSFYIFLNAIMDKIYWNTGQFILGAYAGTKAIAVFAVSIQLQRLYMSFSQAISGVFLPKVTAMTINSNSSKGISDLFIKTGRIQYIVMSLILSGFVIFGKSFIHFWAGPEYSDAYYICLILFIPLTVPLIQNLGITILQARNQLRFRSITYFFIALGSLGFQLLLAPKFEGIGVAIGISIALIAGQIITMNIYYYRVQKINTIAFWKEIAKMTVAPLVITLFTFYLTHKFQINSIYALAIAIVIYLIVYIPLIWKFAMNDYEKSLVKKPVIQVFSMIKKLNDAKHA